MKTASPKPNKSLSPIRGATRPTNISEGTNTSLPPKEILYFDIETTIKEISTQVMSKYIA